MMRLAILAGIAFWAALAFGVYQGAIITRAQEAYVQSLNKQIAQEQAAIKVLRADWAMLTKPDRLQDLAMRHTELRPVAAAQFTQMASLPMRAHSPPPTVTLQDVPKRPAAVAP